MNEQINMIYIPENEYRKLLKESEILHKTLAKIEERSKEKKELNKKTEGE
jgi:hypothetical protein